MIIVIFIFNEDDCVIYINMHIVMFYIRVSLNLYILQYLDTWHLFVFI